MKRTVIVGTIVVAGLSGFLLAACGGDDDTSGDTTAATGGSKSGPVTVAMKDFAFDPADPTLSAGAVEISADNVGKVEHELVLFRTDEAADSLPVKGGEVDEEEFEEESGAKEVGEIEDVEPGEAKSAEFKLTPGNYVMICNVPGHYEDGMYGTITVQ